MLSSNGSGRLAGTIPLSLTYSNPVYFKGAMNPDALAVLRGAIGLAVSGHVWNCTIWRFGLCTHPSFQGEVSHNQNVSASATAVVQVLPFQASDAESRAPRMATLRALPLATFLDQESRSSMGRGLEQSYSASHGPSQVFFNTQMDFVLQKLF